MSALFEAVVLLLLASVVTVAFLAAMFSLGMFIYFYSWRRSLKDPGEQA